MADFFDVVRHQRAHRRFAPDDVDDAQIERCLEAATRAPSAENRQPWDFVVVRDAQTRAAIGELTRQAWRSGGRAHSVDRLSPALLADVDAGAEGGIAAAPVLIVVCGDTERALPSTLPASVFPAVQNLLLAAEASGLGSAMTTLAVQRAGALHDLLRLPEHVVPMAVVPLGRPARPLGPSRRQPVADRAHREVYGAAW